jgi:N-acetylmuramoyl-L-alanine amidase
MKRFFRFILLLVLLVVGWHVYQNEIIPREKVFELAATSAPDWVDQQIIKVDGDSRRGVMLEGVRNIVIHYVGNPGTTAEQNRDYYANSSSEVSSHFVIGLNGEIIQCIPLHEKSSASNHRNKDTISIEVCHPDESGKFTDASYQSLVKLTVWLCEICDLDSGDVIRHYDITGKQCPLYFVTHENAWERFKKDVAISIAK